MIINKRIINQIEKTVRRFTNKDSNKWELKKMQTDIRGIRSMVSRLRKIVDSRPNSKCSQCNCRLEKKDA